MMPFQKLIRAGDLFKLKVKEFSDPDSIHYLLILYVAPDRNYVVFWRLWIKNSIHYDDSFSCRELDFWLRLGWERVE